MWSTPWAPCAVSFPLRAIKGEALQPPIQSGSGPLLDSGSEAAGRFSLPQVLPLAPLRIASGGDGDKEVEKVRQGRRRRRV